MMLVVKVDLCPQGDRRGGAGMMLGSLEIWNDESGTESHGNYIALLKERNGIGGGISERRVRLEGVPRSTPGSHWGLIRRAIEVLFGTGDFDLMGLG